MASFKERRSGDDTRPIHRRRGNWTDPPITDYYVLSRASAPTRERLNECVARSIELRGPSDEHRRSSAPGPVPSMKIGGGQFERVTRPCNSIALEAARNARRLNRGMQPGRTFRFLREQRRGPAAAISAGRCAGAAMNFDKTDLTY